MRARSRVQFFLNPVDCSLLGFSVREIAQARILEWVIIFSSRRSSWPTDQAACLMSPALAGGFFTNYATWEFLFKH